MLKLLKMTKFCANLSFMFKEKPFLERYSAASDAGFKTVESGFPFGFTKEQVVEAKNKANIHQVLINILTGDVTKGEMGYAAIPGQEQKFSETLETTIDYAKALCANKIHIMSGKVQSISDANYKTLVNNMKYAASRLHQENILGIIEPINKYSAPNYYMNNYDLAVDVLKTVNSQNLKLQLDIFHLQLIKGDITHSIQELKPYIGHVQIAQAPNRNEPDTAGEIDYKYVLDVLQKEGNYFDWIGLEYNPLSDTVKGLKWVENWGLSL